MGRRASKLYDACWHAEARDPLRFILLTGAALALFWSVLVGPWSATPWLTLNDYASRYNHRGERGPALFLRLLLRAAPRA